MIERITSPADIADLNPEELSNLAQEIRDFLIAKVSKSGGHLGPNLGVVELTMAIHRTFNSPKDVVLFDTGHQSYVHKILTGRAGDFDNLRKRGGIAGYPNRSESEHDVIENSHASTALSWGDGISRGFSLTGQRNRSVVVVVGDGALTGGMSWEALNNIATSDDRNLVIVVNDNARSYSPTIGGLADHLASLRVSRGYEQMLSWGKRTLQHIPVVGPYLYDAVHGMKKGIKDFLAPQGMFEDLGLKYMGPIDGHNIAAMEKALHTAKHFGAPVLVHAITEKGRGHRPALDDEAEKFHAVGVVDPVTGIPVKPSGTSWTSVFSKEIVAIGKERPDVVALTAAMLGPTGLEGFQKNFPHRTIDVGIAEQHAVTSAAGLAFAGMHPVVAVYATFLNRAFDQLLLDVALHHAGVTFVLDRSGVTGDDGPSHNGIWDLALTGIVPTLHVGAPRDGSRLRELLNESIAIKDAPSLVRFPKGEVQSDIPEIERRDGVDVLHLGENSDVLLIGVGALAHMAIDAAKEAGKKGVGVTVVDPRWVKPIPLAIAQMLPRYKCVVVLEDGIRHGGIGSSISELARDANISVPIHSIGVPLEFIEHSSRSQILHDLGITAAQIAQSIIEWSELTKLKKPHLSDGSVDQSQIR
ncbi:MAG: 1-deoxy-D-xylulose-5-phosphate synthase [Actinobacteria bacterium]|uniref:1-deoxy-D-xylulose-5-phosphate synthase n=1 Tax=freshwater metagenome TaxID=449393 RepID=A0A6J7CGG1_9ZZZZ|nr:1-deoxy-D-xylulose-5-phosphate synthase [Actinomycetota bacterium]MSX24390.1 1-deoxy-D-xylulose-5-phosphate synthase [Actinomycetota bacterium]MSY46708.1 1-deoxy-D-xylulose-5-phosphate synthase [Actinomycetota bacterium]MSY57028.1 1-deoxy-D-xylulose-5-phosphate synthase [Actinomycetota bacterium]MTB00074.1 1-deoxy-D-xylulose-5-phosphate synthase [Actinomycetota bacterium]